MDFEIHWSLQGIVAHTMVVIVVAIRVIMLRPVVGVGLAWLFIVTALPGAGVLLYLVMGERRVSRRRRRRIARLRTDYRELAAAAINDDLVAIDWSNHPPAANGLDQLGRTLVGSRTVRGSQYELHSDTPEVLAAIARDIDGAEHSVLMEFYIWNQGGSADDVLAAVIRAAERGVRCRVLVDALGGRPWWKGTQPKALRQAGVEVLPALPVGPLRMFLGRTDLRLHRKIVVVDGEVAWTGSLNMVDPRYFKQGAGVGQWVDAMTRLTGAAVVPLAAIMIGDWALETGEDIHSLIRSSGLHRVAPNGTADVQVIPSGPCTTGDGLLQMILGLVNAAQKQLVLTTPYLVPDDSLYRALRGAAARGVDVSLILPEKVDSLLTRYASRSYYDELLDAGVSIHLFRDGLLHTKSIMVDGSLSMFGTVNLDMRSLWLNYEVSLFVYDRDFATSLREVQRTYMDASMQLDAKTWSERSFGERFLENTCRLFGPLL